MQPRHMTRTVETMHESVRRARCGLWISIVPSAQDSTDKKRRGGRTPRDDARCSRRYLTCTRSGELVGPVDVYTYTVEHGRLAWPGTYSTRKLDGH